ncbi:MAG TPA: diacylglycerol kinase [Gammaproteobacteria bacterium]
MSLAANAVLRRIVNATLFSIAGLRAAWREEPPFRYECVVAAVLVPVGAWLGRTALERALLLGCLLLVLVVELLNSAIEAAVDRVGTEHHPLAGQAKDMGSAAVFVTLLLTLLVWASIAGGRWL